MSKEIAQTVGGKKFGLMLALLAAIAVTLGIWQSQQASATTVINPTPPTVAPTSVLGGGTVTFTSTVAVTTAAANTGSVTINVPTGFTATGTATCTAAAAQGTATASGATTCNLGGTPTADGNITIAVTATASSTVGAYQATASATDGTNSATSSAGQTVNVVASLGTVSGTAIPVGTLGTVSIQIPAGVTYCSDAGTAGAARSGGAVGGAGADVQLTNPAGLQAGETNVPTTALNNAVGTHTLTGVPGGQNIILNLHTVGSGAAGCATTTVATTSVTPFLRHMVGQGDNTVSSVQDIFNNVRGSRHVVCATNGNDTTPVGVVIPLTQANQIAMTPGGYYQVPGDQSPSQPPVDIQFFTKTIGGATATCFSWISTGAGDQQIIATYPNAVAGGLVTVNYGGTAVNGSLVKEWNVLESSSVTTSTTGVALSVTNGATPGKAGNPVVNYSATTTSLTLDPNTGLHRFGDIQLQDFFTGSHTTSAGGTNGTVLVGGGSSLNVSLAGVPWTVILKTGSCGILVNNGSTGVAMSAAELTAAGGGIMGFRGATYNLPNGTVDPASLPNVLLRRGGDAASDCTVGRTAVVQFTGTEAGPLGSGAGNTVTQTVTVNFNQVIPIKQVLLAWAGQRVILEHDWRIPAGDVTSAASTCPFTTGQTFAYVRGAESPGNFIPALGGVINGNDEIDVALTGVSKAAADSSQVGTTAGSGDATLAPQDACITRAQYESEDQGEVDVELFPTTGLIRLLPTQFGQAAEDQSIGVDSGVGKVAFVVYYMKLNNVTLSLATQVSKPSHNGINSTTTWDAYADWAPGNPWDASKDATASSADWNVSKDILVRGRVTGWFTNSNPSGRARDESNKQNVLPADRWVMPDDWVNIAGGAALASSFRPSYDLMFDPDNAGLALGLPWGTSAAANQVAAVAANSVGKGNSLTGVPLGTGPIIVTTTVSIAAGNSLIIGTTPVTVCAVSGLNITVATATGNCTNALGLLTAPAAGTPIFKALGGYPFVGPYSLIDVPGFAGTPGAALENDGNGVPSGFQFRDTTQGDLKVDWWDAPMPPAETTVTLSGTGFLKQVLKEDVYYNGSPNTLPVGQSGTQTYPNPYYWQNIPASPYLPAVASGGGYSWDSWGGDGPNTTGCLASSFNPCAGGNGPYHFWQPFAVLGDTSLSSTRLAELNAIRTAYGITGTPDSAIGLGFVVYSDNHGEFMVAANGDFRTDLTACSANVLAGGKQCKTGDKVGVATISAVADYPDFVKHFPVASNAVTVNWTWGGYKDVTIEKGATDQYSYVVFHGMDRDGFCGAAPTGAVLLHSLFTPYDAASPVGSNAAFGNQLETVDFLIDSGSGIILANSGLPILPTGLAYTGAGGSVSGERGNVIGVPTYSVALETAFATGKKTFPVSALAQSGQTDECQAWIQVSNSLLGVTNVLAIAHDDEGNIGFDKVIDFQSTMSYTLNFRWSLITWNGADNIPVADALKGGASTKNPAGNDISASVTAVYGWDQAAQQWLAFFPTGVNVPGANNLTALKDGSAYWIAITGPGSVTWTVSTNVS